MQGGCQEPHSGFLGRGRRGGEGGGGQIVIKVFKVSPLRLVEQIIEDVGTEEVFKVFSLACETNSVRCGSGGAVLRRDCVACGFSVGNPGHYFYEPVAVTLAFVFMRQSTKAFGRISCGFLCEGVLGP